MLGYICQYTYIIMYKIDIIFIVKTIFNPNNCTKIIIIIVIIKLISISNGFFIFRYKLYQPKYVKRC